MTPEQMDRLDKALAVKLMDYKLICSPDCEKFPLPYVEDKKGNKFSFKPTRRIEQAFMVAKEMRQIDKYGKSGFNFNLNWQQLPEIEICIAQFHRISGGLEHGQGADNEPSVAICLAAAPALGIEVEKE